MEPETRYALLDGNRIAYQIVGDGPIDVVASLGTFSTMDGLWALPEAISPYLRLSSRCRLILFDRLGTGWSDAVPLDVLPPIQSRWTEIQTVMEAAESERAVIFAKQDGGPGAMFGAVTAPDQVAGLILFHCPARHLWAPDYPVDIKEETSSAWREMLTNWDIDTMMQMAFPSRADDPRVMKWGRRYVRTMATPAAMLAYVEDMFKVDVRDLLPLIDVPTLVLRRQDHRWTTTKLDRFVADHIPDAQFVEVPGGDGELYFEESGLMVDAITSFLADIQPTTQEHHDVDRLMATILFTDIVASTEKAHTTGDSEWVAASAAP